MTSMFADPSISQEQLPYCFQCLLNRPSFPELLNLLLFRPSFYKRENLELTELVLQAGRMPFLPPNQQCLNIEANVRLRRKGIETRSSRLH